jgi:hypothetical protein
MLPGGVRSDQSSLAGQHSAELTMQQSRAMSLIEALANVAVGYGVAVLTQIAVFALFGLSVTLTQNLMMGGLFTLVSIVRSYALRRVFERVRICHSQR